MTSLHDEPQVGTTAVEGGQPVDNYVIGLTTFESAEQAQSVIDAVLEEHLAACVQVISISSSYVWKGEVCREPEVLVLLKTRGVLYPKLQQRLIDLHPYETPEVIQVPITAGAPAYLRWIDDSTLSSG